MARRGPLVATLSPSNLVHVAQGTQAHMNQDAQDTYNKVSAELVRLFQADGSPKAGALPYKDSTIAFNGANHTCVTVSITGLDAYTGACLQSALQAARCRQDEWKVDYSRSRGDTHPTITLLCPLPQAQYNASLEIPGAAALSHGRRDRRGWLRSWLEDSCTVGFCLVVLLVLVMCAIVSWRLFDCSMTDNVQLMRTITGFVMRNVS